MAAADYSFSIEKGTAFVMAFEYRDDTNTPIDITNWCARIRWIEDNVDQTVRTFVTNTSNETYQFYIEPLLGKIVLKIPAKQTAGYNFGVARYDFELQEPNDLYSGGGRKVFRILQGTISLISRNVNVPGDDTSVFSCNTDGLNDCGTCPS
jgi:hypothetical protein